MFVIILVSIVAHVRLYSQCTLDKTNWRVVFEDEFNGTKADLANKWYFNFDSEQTSVGECDDKSSRRVCITEDNVSVSNGKLYLRAKRLNSPDNCGGTANYSMGALRAKYAKFPQSFCSPTGETSESGFLYGMFEIRCKLPSTPASFPAFWLTGSNAWPPEIDAFEYNGNDRNRFFSSHRYSNKGVNTNCSVFYNYPYNVDYEYHTWNVVWTPEKITWFYDGKELHSTDYGVPGEEFSNVQELCKWRKMDLILNNGVNCPAPGSSNFDPLIVDYVKVYEPSSMPPFTGGSFTSYINDVYRPTYNSVPYKSNVDWNMTKTESDEYFDYNVLSSLNVVKNGTKYIYKGDHNLLWNTYKSQGKWYSTPISWDDSYAVSDNVDTADDGDIIVFRQGSRIRIRQNSTLRIVESSRDIVADYLTIDESGLHMYCKDTGGRLRHFSRTSLSTLSWNVETLPTVGSVNGNIILSNSDPLTIFYRDSYGDIQRVQKKSGTWRAQSMTSARDVRDSYSLSPNGDKLFYHSTTSRLYVINNVNLSSPDRSEIKVKYPWTSSSVSVNNITSSVNVAGSPLQVFYKGTDKRIWTLYQKSAGVWEATSLDWTVKYVRDNVVAFNNRTILFVGDDKKVREFRYDSCENLNPNCKLNINKSFDDTTKDHQVTDNSADNQVSDLNVLALHPNPNNGSFNIRSNKEFSTVIVQDIQGKVIFTVRTPSVLMYEYNDHSLSPGMYFVTVVGTTWEKTLKMYIM